MLRRRVIRSAFLVAAMTGSLLVMAPSNASPNRYVTMSDGIQIAINISCPHALDEPPISMSSLVPPTEGTGGALSCPGGPYPTILQMSGYDGGSATGRTLLGELHDTYGPSFPQPPLADDGRQVTWQFTPNYVTIEASVRGTGCSGGEFDLFSSRSALDGRELIEWISNQNFSNGKVGLFGHSYSGLTATMIAETRPPQLTAMTVSGLIDDLYRGITYPGGVSNYGFPLYWTGAIRPLYDVGGGTMAGLLRPLDDPSDTERQQCAGNVATHSRTVGNDPIVQGAVGDTDNDWWRARSLISDIDNINVPIHITGAYQDEQTGARGPAHLWEQVAGVPKRLVLTNGDHGTNTNTTETRNDRVAWMDHWMRGASNGFGTLAADEKSVKVLLEMKNSPRASNGSVDAADFPLPGTTWTDYKLSTGGSLTTGPATTGNATYVSGSARQSYQRLQGDPNSGEEFAQAAGPDELRFASAPVSTDTVVAGPITATLNLSSTAPDTEIYIEIDDIGPGGVSHLQRGLLKASHRAITDALSDHNSNGDIYRPFRPHTNPTNILPGTTYKYLVEIWPVGHVFRAGHRIGIKIAAPPLVDGIYAYIPKRPVSLNTIFFGGADPSRIMLPIVPVPSNLSSAAPACGALDSVRCTTEAW